MAEISGSTSSQSRWRDDDGYILPQTALLLIPLIIFAALATDVGGWYLQAQKIQRAADAAALGAVAFLPDVNAAEAHARAVATRNGYTDITPGDNTDLDTGDPTQVEVEFLGAGRLEVEIKGYSDAFFGRLVLDGIEITRYARSQQVTPIRMGNPTTALGTGDLTSADIGPGLDGDNVWLGFGAYCRPRSAGDPFLSGAISVGGGAGNGCTGQNIAMPNPDYDPNAYIFVVETQPGGGPVDIQVREPGAPCPGSADTVAGFTGTNPVLVFDIYGPNPNTNHRNFVEGSAPNQQVIFPATACNGWYDLATNLPGLANGGFYYVNAYTRGPGTTQAGGGSYLNEDAFNTISMRITPSGSGNACTFSTANPLCPQLYALDWLPVYANLIGDTEVFLAEVPESFAGGTLTVSFFDAAEGISGLQFAGPDGVAVPFDWRYADNSVGNVTGPGFNETAFGPATATCNWNGTGPGPCLDTQAGDWNDHHVEIEFTVPPNYQCAADCWWTIRFGSPTFPTDFSTWTVFADGDPIRLIE